MSQNYTTWFGEWPPRIRGDKSMTDGQPRKSIWKKIFSVANIILGIVTVGGGLLIWLTEGFWHSFGEALVIAGIIGITIDNYMSYKLAKDAVEAALGYILPEPLKEEMRWVVGLQFLATELDLKYTIHRKEGDEHLVILSAEMRQKIWNFTNATQDKIPQLSIDEMGVTGEKSKIDEFRYKVDGHNWVTVDASKPILNKDTIEVKAEKQKVPSDKFIEIEYKWHITKRDNDVEFMVLPTATKTPILNVVVDDSLEYRQGFTHRNGHKGKEVNILSGTLLPYQSIYVRWWPKNGQE